MTLDVCTDPHVGARGGIPGAASPDAIGPPPPRFKGPTTNRAPAEMISVLQDRVARGDGVLDAGCGGAHFRRPLEEELGLRYVGVDLFDEKADVLADLHNIPFADSSFSAVVSNAVLSLCSYPGVALAEIARVLRPEGVLVATISFLEPDIGDHTRWTSRALVGALASAGLRAERVWSCRDTLDALGSYIGPYPSIVKAGMRSLRRVSEIGPLAPRRWLRETGEDRERRRLATAGNLGFVAVRSETGAWK